MVNAVKYQFCSLICYASQLLALYCLLSFGLRNAFSDDSGTSVHYPLTPFSTMCFCYLLFVAFILNLMLSNLPVSLFIICFAHWKVHIRKPELTTSWTPALTIVPT